MRAPLAVILLKRDGHILKTNPAFCQLIGFSEAELKSLKLTDLIHPDDREADLEMTRELFSDDISHFGTEMRYRRKDGSWLSVAVSATDIREDKKPLYSIRVVQDITERRRLEASLETSVENFRLLCQASLEGVLIHDNNRIVFANASLGKMLGYGLQEITKMRPDDLFAPESQKLALRQLGAGNGFPLDVLGVRKNGVTIPIRICVKRIVYGEFPMRLTSIQDRSVMPRNYRSQAAKSGARVSALSPREIEVFRLLVQGTDNLKISITLGISRRTVEHHVSHILTKLGVKNRTAAVLAAYESGLLEGVRSSETTRR